MPVKQWPCVMDEFQTVAKLQEGMSLSRLGDGEIALCDGSDQVREPKNPALAKELRQIISVPQDGLVVGIPTMDRAGPKYPNWAKRAARFMKFLSPDMTYGSAFVSRPDSAPAIESFAYCDALQQCWSWKKVVVVAEPTSKLPVAVRVAARKTLHIPCPSREAYAALGHLEREVLRHRPEIVLLSHGPSATCFAARLARHGVQALDLGSIGGMLCRLLPVERVDHVYPFALRHPVYQGDLEAMQAVLTAAGFEIYFAAEKEGTSKEDAPHA